MTKGTGIRIRPQQGDEYISSLLTDIESYKVDAPQFHKWLFFDTFDWRLFNRSTTLYSDTRTLVMRDLNTGEIMSSAIFPGVPIFASNLPESILKEKLQSITDVRALLLIAAIQVQLLRYRVLNKDQKTVAYLNYIHISPGIEKSPEWSDAYISVDPVRGYDKPHQNLCEAISKIGSPIPIYKSIYMSNLRKARLSPGSYTNQLNLALDPEMNALEAMRLIFTRLLEIMRANEAGIKADIDTEFLHDYRVSVRKTRAALGQLKGILPKESNDKYRNEFSTYGKFTNQLRDLDVYLLSETTYRQMLPETMREHINPLFDYLRSLRVDVHRDVTEVLNSETYKSYIQEWKSFLQNLQVNEYSGPAASKPILELAKKRIYKQFSRILDLEYLLEGDVENSKLHRLRIECKKLRYLLEFFDCLFPQDEINLCIKQLKKLQDHLGKFNDLVIQQDYLLEITSSMPIHDGNSRLAFVATGYLIDQLGQRQANVKSDFGKVFCEFLSSENINLYKLLFK